MKKKTNVLNIVGNILCIVMLLALFASFFLPSWEYTASRKVENSREWVNVEESVSVMEYTWMAYDHKGLTKEFTKEFGKKNFSINDVVTMPFILTICVIVCAVFGLWKMKSNWQSLFALVGSGFAVMTLLNNQVLQMGPSWMINLILACAALAASLFHFALLVKSIVEWFVVKHRRL